MQAKSFIGMFSSSLGGMFKSVLLPALIGQEGICKPWQGPMRVDWEDTQ